jgi:hypothetical protein
LNFSRHFNFFKKLSSMIFLLFIYKIKTKEKTRQN